LLEPIELVIRDFRIRWFWDFPRRRLLRWGRRVLGIGLLFEVVEKGIVVVVVVVL